MRTTVGPLAPAVYWRRRAVVIGALLVVVLLLAYSCTGGDGKKSAKDQAARTAPSPSASSTPPVLLPTGPDPTGSPPIYPPSGPGAGSGSASAPAPTGDTVNAQGSPCADSELQVVPAAEALSVRQGVPIRFFIKIKNVSGRTCVRDVGAQMQELYMQQGSTRHWSSDACDNRGSNADVVTFAPNFERAYYLTWDGKSTAAGCTNQPWIAAGTYQLVGRLGTKVSDPVTFTVTG